VSPLTRVHLRHWPKVADDWLRFGLPASEQLVDRRRTIAGFATGAVFAYVRWRGGDYGTISWRLAVLRAATPDAPVTALAGVWPGAEVLLSVSGEGPVRRAFAVIDGVEAVGVDPAEASPDYWRVAHNRLAAYAAPRPYGLAEHAAWIARREVAA
jgi:hypothetical protein